MSADFFLNIVIIILLVITIVYAMILNHRLSLLKDSKRDILRAVASFQELTMSAETMLHQMHHSTQTVADQLKTEINKANTLRDDLVLLMERQPTKPIQKPIPSYYPTYEPTKKQTTPPSRTPPKAESTPRPTSAPASTLDTYQSEAERELFEALQRLKG